MALLSTPTTFTATIEEAFADNADCPVSNIIQVNNVAKSDHRKAMAIDSAAATTIANFSTDDAAGTYIAAKVKYFRITNKDNTNYVTIKSNAGGVQKEEAKLLTGESLVWTNITGVGAAAIDTITAQFNSADGFIDMMIVQES